MWTGTINRQSSGWTRLRWRGTRTEISCRRNGMSTSLPNPGERVRDVHLTEDALAVDLADGRTIIVPLAWYPRLLGATPEQRSHWRVSGAGYGFTGRTLMR